MNINAARVAIVTTIGALFTLPVVVTLTLIASR